MSDEERRTVEERLASVERQLNLLEAVLDIDPHTHETCRGDPGECGDDCQEESCPLRNNQVARIGDLFVTLIEELRWHRAWIDEYEHLGITGEESRKRVALRVKRDQHRDALRDAERFLENARAVPDLMERVQARVSELRAEIDRITEELS